MKKIIKLAITYILSLTTFNEKESNNIIFLCKYFSNGIELFFYKKCEYTISQNRYHASRTFYDIVK